MRSDLSMAEVAASILQSASKDLGSLLVEEGRFLYAVREKIQKLRLDLDLLLGFLQDAAKKQHDSEVIRIWVAQIRDLAYEADDTIEKYVVRICYRNEGSVKAWSTVKRFSCAPCNVFQLHQVGSDIEALSLRMSELTSRLQLCGVQSIPRDDSSSVRARLGELRRTDSHIGHEDVIVGLKEDVDIVVHQLVNMDTNVVAISGMGGLGKTTLAKKACNHETVKGHFHTLIWVFVSQQFETGDIFRAILRKIWAHDDNKRKLIRDLGDEELSGIIRAALQEKSYLVVLDDLWKEESWNRLRCALSLPRKSASKLLLTTRNLELQQFVDQEGYLHKQEPLSPHDSWDLLYKIASQGQYTIDSQMKKLGEKMLRHCQYLPLAIVIIGGMLKLKNTRDGWKAIHDHIHLIITSSNSQGMRISEVLGLSYDELPFFLRPCFLYMACFPEDFKIYAKKLYRMWEAEGLISLPPNVKFEKMITLDDAAELCLEELANRCMVQVETRDNRGKIKCFRIHDLMRDMCEQKAREESFVSIISNDEKPDSNELSSSLLDSTMDTRLHRLAIHVNNYQEKRSDNALKKAIKGAVHLRSVLFFSPGECFPDCILQSSLLRTLELEGLQISRLPKQIGHLLHLRYLSLRYTGLKELPQSIGKLRCLQFLDLRTAPKYEFERLLEVLLPNVVWKMRMLRHLYLPLLYCVGKYDTLSFHTLNQLVTLKNLRLKHCDVVGLLEVKSLTRLTLQGNIDNYNIKTLQLLLTSTNVASGLLAKPLLIRIAAGMLKDMEFGKVISYPGYKLSVGGMLIGGKIFPSRLDSLKTAFENLTSLTFFFSDLRTDPMPVLEKLPKLSHLRLYNCFLGEKLTCSTSWFPELTHLDLLSLLNLEEWEVEVGAMPKLRRVKITDCRKLNQVPDNLAETVEIECKPCVPGIERYGACVHAR